MYLDIGCFFSQDFISEYGERVLCRRNIKNVVVYPRIMISKLIRFRIPPISFMTEIIISFLYHLCHIYEYRRGYDELKGLLIKGDV